MDSPVPLLIIILHTVCTIRFVGSQADCVQVGTRRILVLGTVAGTWLDSMHVLNGQMLVSFTRFLEWKVA